MHLSYTEKQIILGIRIHVRAHMTHIIGPWYLHNWVL